MFDKERAKLVLKALNHEPLLPSESNLLERVKGTIAAIANGDTITDLWSIDDIMMRDNRIRDAEARDILAGIQDNMDAEIGINWDVIDSAIACHDHEEY